MKKCKNCKQPFEPRLPMQVACSPACALAMAVSKRGKEEKRALVREKRADKAKREKLKSRAQWLKEAKVAIQGARRLEELSKGRGCMSCGRSRQEVEAGPWRPGGYWDGGHFLSKGAHPEMALEPKNIWLQCKSCNAGSSKYAGKGRTVSAAFEENLARAEGQALVDWLKGPHPAKHSDIDDLKAIKAKYTAKARELKKAMQ